MRQTRTAGESARVWLDTQADLTRRVEAWCDVLETAEVGDHDRVLVALPLASAASWDARAALVDRGALVFATEGVSLTEVVEFGPTAIISTPTDVLRLMHSAAQRNVDLSEQPPRVALLTGEPGGSLDVMRRLIQARWSARCLDVYTLTELGPIGWGCRFRNDGIHLDDRQLLFESDEVGELLVSTLPDWPTPLQHYPTGDVVRLGRIECACGRGSLWADGGVLGRISDRLRVRGRDILPSTIEQVVRRHPAVVDLRLHAFTRRAECEVAVQVEASESIASEGDRARVAAEVSEDLRRSLGLRLQCDVVPPGSFTNDHDAGRRARRLTRL